MKSIKTKQKQAEKQKFLLKHGPIFQKYQVICKIVLLPDEVGEKMTEKQNDTGWSQLCQFNKH